MIITGVYLMFLDPSYKGFADLGNSWGLVMLIKHILVVIMIGLGYFTDRNLLPAVSKPSKGKQGANPFVRQLKMIVNLLAFLGVLILLMTALAQVL
jgi:putative copper export protein